MKKMLLICVCLDENWVLDNKIAIAYTGWPIKQAEAYYVAHKLWR